MRSIVVAFTTFRESVRQPVFYALLLLGVVLLAFSYVMPTFTLATGEVKFIRDIGLGTYTLCILLLGIFSSANLITTEIENKTAMTVMSKPLRRYEFIVGKYGGIVLSVLVLATLLTSVFVAVIVAKVAGGDIVQTGADTYEAVWPEVAKIFPGLVVGFLQTLVLVAVSVAFSTRMPMILNVSLSFALFIMASLSGPVMDAVRVAVAKALQQNPAAAKPLYYYVATAAYYVLPNFQSNTEIYSAIGLGSAVPWPLVGLTTVYSGLYIGAAVAAAIFLFQDRELG